MMTLTDQALTETKRKSKSLVELQDPMLKLRREMQIKQRTGIRQKIRYSLSLSERYLEYTLSLSVSELGPLESSSSES
jgi:uncharacterized protein YxjI